MTIRPAVLAAATAAIVSVAFMPGRAQQSPARRDGEPAPRSTELAQPWSRSRRPLDRRERSQRTAARGLLRRRRRRALEDHRRRGELDAGHRWTDQELFGRRRRRVRSNPDVVFIGMGESCIRGNIMPGDGVYKSTDAGKTWNHVGFSDSQAISKIRIHPTNPDIVFVASFGKYGAPSAERGVFKSTDGGKTWKKTLFRDDKTGAVDISIDRRNPNVMYAAMWEAYRVEYQMSSGGPGSGLFKSTDGGETWTEITRSKGMPAGMIGRIGVSVSGADANRVYALVENQNGGLFAQTMRAVVGAGERQPQHPPARVLLHPRHCRSGRQRHRLPAERQWLPLDRRRQDADQRRPGNPQRSPRPVDRSRQSQAPRDRERRWRCGVDGGRPGMDAAGFPDGAVLPRRHHGAPSVSRLRRAAGRQHGLHRERCGVASRCADRHGASAARRGGAAGTAAAARWRRRTAGRRRGRGGGAPQMYGAGGSENGTIAPDPKDVDVIFAVGNNGTFLTRLNRKTGEQREVSPYPRMFSGEPSSALVERWTWNQPLIFSPVDPNVLYTSSQHLWKTTNQGQSWTKISGDLTRHDPKTMGPSGGPITGDMNGPEVYATIFAIGPGKTDVNIIWAGSDDGLVHVTRDGGKTWTNVTPKEMPEFGRVSQIDASAFDAGTAYIAVKKPLLNDLAPYIFRTRDFGKSWTKIVNGIGAVDYVHVVREDRSARD